MERKDWEELDRLLGLEGFGGYYDLVECLKDIARDWVTDCKDNLGNLENIEKIVERVDNIKTIKSSISFLHAFGRIRRKEGDSNSSQC